MSSWAVAAIVVGSYGAMLIVVSALVQGMLLGRTRRPGNKPAGDKAMAKRDFASWPRRFAALVVDVTILVAIAAISTVALGPITGSVTLCLMASVYFPFGFARGVTVGSALFGFRIEDSRGRQPGLPRGALRFLMFFSTMFPTGGRTAAFAAPGVTFYLRTMQGGHDRLAGTYVVRLGRETRRSETLK